jgi:phosphatidylserine/phosphatidylglycerophosphate/cardiolipin synthase-like enzyme
VARELSAFLAGARHSLDVAMYDLKLGPPTLDILHEALAAAHDSGVAIRIAYNVDHGKRVPVPAPPTTPPALVESLPGETRAIPGVPDLMHHKYVVRDGTVVWSGSTNWTDESWTRQENVVVVLESALVAAAFTADFEQLWSSLDVSRSGKVAPEPVVVDGVEVRAWFCPGRGERLAHRIAHALGHAERRIRIASPVITSGPILGTLAELASDGRLDLAGVVDVTQIREVLAQWHANGNASWKMPALVRALGDDRFTGKPSTKWSPTSVHDFMHAKVTVADDTLFVGSFNLSHSGELNAENVIEISDAGLAAEAAAFVDAVRVLYPPVRLTL